MTSKRSSNHARNTGPMMAAPRCGARTRQGTPCRSPAVQGKTRCRMHGGAHGSGAPKGNHNALKHGCCSREAIARRKAVNQVLRVMRETLCGLD